MKNNLARFYFDRGDIFMIAIANDETVADINQKGSQTLGYPKEQIIGKNWFDNFIPPTNREETRKLFHEMLNGPLRHIHYEHPVVTKKGTEKILNWHNILASDKKGNTIGMLSSASDVTQQRKIEQITQQTENNLQISTDHMIEGYQIIDYDYRYAYLNQAAANQGRKTKQELIGKTMMQAYPGIENTQMFNHLRNAMTNRVPHHMENQFNFPDGATGWFELRMEPVPQGVLILSLDITKKKENEDELNNYRQRLEQVIAERTADCVQTKQQLTFETQENKKAQEGLKLRAAILDSTQEAIFLANTKGDLAFANQAASDIYGYKPEELLTLNLRQLLSSKEAEELPKFVQQVIEKGQLDLKATHLRKNGEPINVQVHHTLIKTMYGQFIVAVIRQTT